MKTTLTTLLLLLFSFAIFCQGNQYIMVDYMKVPEGGSADYLSLEQEVWKPMHQELIKQGKLDGWFLYQIPFPGGTSSEYQYATVRVYSSMVQIGETMDLDIPGVFKKVHAGKDLSAIGQKTQDSRDLVKTYGYVQWDAFFDESLPDPAKVLAVVYFKVPMDKWDAYQEMEKKYYHPTHKAEIKAGKRAGWAGYRLARPMGTSMPFQFAAVDHYKDWDQYIKQSSEADYEGIFEGNEMEVRDDIFGDTVELVNLEEWHLIDYVWNN